MSSSRPHIISTGSRCHKSNVKVHIGLVHALISFVTTQIQPLVQQLFGPKSRGPQKLKLKLLVVVGLNNHIHIRCVMLGITISPTQILDVLIKTTHHIHGTKISPEQCESSHRTGAGSDTICNNPSPTTGPMRDVGYYNMILGMAV
ncbi:Uncharacterized protein TCM_043416 [Theobroma cacao]|uniref:Uncharacterized protein n=1 Tax=Theobroma cacao TaxID=3641 RepID=A0A061FPS7_THECC|nr:Uncharacterized protein TCM_043416 [Theobroma cacao]